MKMSCVSWQMKNVLLLDEIYEVQGHQLYNRHLQKVVHTTVCDYSAQLTDDKSDDENEKQSSKRSCTLDQECVNGIYSILFGADQIDT